MEGEKRPDTLVEMICVLRPMSHLRFYGANLSRNLSAVKSNERHDFYTPLFQFNDLPAQT